MKNKLKILTLTLSILFVKIASAQTNEATIYHEQFRPQLHFSPKEHWVNDPNGMVYFKGIYHLFFQYYPKGTTWGPMHWGHAISKDLMHWQELPIALYPDSLGYIFSGSAVVDSNNTSGFGKNGKIPLIAIFTQHDPKGEQAGKDNFQNESIAYSLDDGYTWTKYANNPVLMNPGIRDFRDPKVMWYAQEKKWVMTLATKDHITFYSSPNLKDWMKESEFGKELGAHGGVWECPDLFPLKFNNKTYWVLIVNLNPGGPNGGSGTQYFVGNFNGHTFTPADNELRWLDYGPDEYAGVTWGNTGNRKIFLGWMSNWEYAGVVPTEKWRNAMTIPRELALKQVAGRLLLASQPVNQLGSIAKKAEDISSGYSNLPNQYILKFKALKTSNCAIELLNKAGEKLVIGYDSKNGKFYIDRSKSGTVNFNPEFAKISYAPRFSGNQVIDLTLVIDASSVELFADKGTTVMTSVFFPSQLFNQIYLQSLKQIQIVPLKSIW